MSKRRFLNRVQVRCLALYLYFSLLGPFRLTLFVRRNVRRYPIIGGRGVRRLTAGCVMVSGTKGFDHGSAYDTCVRYFKPFKWACLCSSPSLGLTFARQGSKRIRRSLPISCNRRIAFSFPFWVNLCVVLCIK